LVERGAALHGAAAGQGPARFFLLTIEVNSAVVQEAESRSTGDVATPTAADG
jgi:hypothetical protein